MKPFLNLKLNKINQDRLENLFAWIRSGCGQNTNPSSLEAISEGANCKEADDEIGKYDEFF